MRTHLLAILLLGMFCRCSNVYTYQADDTNLSDYRTYAWLPSKDTLIPNGYSTKVVVEAVNAQMKARGYTLDQDNPELLVLVRAWLDEEIGDSGEGEGAGYAYAGYPYTITPFWNAIYFRNYTVIDDVRFNNYARPTNYTEGVFTVNLIGTENKNVIWKAWTKENTYRDPANVRGDEYITKIFEKFPVSMDRD